jgi:copper chaperone NosL
VKPKPIAYGQQACDFCRMTIVDKQHAAQMITDKGKVYNFDAAECLINYIRGIDSSSIGLILVTDYNRPETLIKAESATFFISEALPSPMGANLSAAATREEAELILQKNKGTLYSWKDLLEHLNK